MKIEVFAAAEMAAQAAAAFIAAQAWAAVEERGRFIIALSGGRTPWRMFYLLGREELPWDRVHVVQVDERVAPAGHPDRNLTHLRKELLENVPLSDAQLHALPVEAADLDAAAARYGKELSALAGSPPVLDLVHLGLGPDGHTASLIPGDPVLDVTASDVAPTGVYQGRRRLTLTYPLLNRARQIMWLVTGREKAEMLTRLCAGDLLIPAGRVNRQQALVFADRAAAGETTSLESRERVCHNPGRD
ncbi:MAG: 6-phosphogluconolactonase [Desulfobulbaceae bacterium]